MGKLIIERENKYCACLSKYNIFLDNILIDSVCNGDSHEYIIPSGNHTLFLQNGAINFGTKSNTIKFCINDNDSVRILCKSGLYNFSGILLKLDIINNVVDNNIIDYNELYDRYRLISKLFELKEAGSLSDEEFENEKRKILRGNL